MERQFKIGDMVTVNNNAGNLKYVGFVTKTYEGGARDVRAPMVPGIKISYLTPVFRAGTHWDAENFYFPYYGINLVTHPEAKTKEQSNV